MLSGKTPKGNKVKVADSAGPSVVYDLFKDSDGVRGGYGDVVNGMYPFRGRLHSFKDAIQRRSRMTPTSSEPMIHEVAPGQKSGHLGLPTQVVVPESVGSAPTEITSAWTPLLKGSRRDNARCLSVYDNGPPTELSVLLGDSRATCLAREAEDARVEDGSLSTNNSASCHRL